MISDFDCRFLVQSRDHPNPLSIVEGTDTVVDCCPRTHNRVKKTERVDVLDRMIARSYFSHNSIRIFISRSLADEKVIARLVGKTVVKTIVVKGKLVNLVVK